VHNIEPMSVKRNSVVSEQVNRQLVR